LSRIRLHTRGSCIILLLLSSTSRRSENTAFRLRSPLLNNNHDNSVAYSRVTAVWKLYAGHMAKFNKHNGNYTRKFRHEVLYNIISVESTSIILVYYYYNNNILNVMRAQLSQITMTTGRKTTLNNRTVHFRVVVNHLNIRTLLPLFKTFFGFHPKFCKHAETLVCPVTPR